MIRLLLALVFALASTTCVVTQNLLVFDQYNSSYVSDIEYLDDSTYVVALRVGTGKKFSTLLWYKDSDFLYDLQYIDRVKKQDIRKENDQLYLDYIFSHDCDAISNGYTTITADTNWVRTEYAIFGNYGDSLQSIWISDTLSILLNENNQLLYKDTSTHSFQTEQLSLNGNIHLQKLETNIALLGENESIIRNVAKLDSSDLILSHANNQGLEIIDYQNQYFLLCEGNISIFNKSGQFENSIEFPDNIQPNDMIIDHNDQLIILGDKIENNSKSYHLFQLTNMDLWTEIYSNEDANLNFREMRLKPNNDIILLGSILENEYREMAFILNTSEENQYTQDLSIDYLGSTITQNPNGINTLKTSIKVNNLSAKDAYNVHVYSTEYGCYNPSESSCECPKLETIIPFIPANSSIDVYLEASIDISLNLKPEICVYISGADQHYDNNLSDNISCNLLLDTEELDIQVSSLDLFPNPASHVLRSKSAEYEDLFEIIDLQGKVLLQAYYNDGLNLSNLHPGFYFARNKTTNRIEKFLKF